MTSHGLQVRSAVDPGAGDGASGARLGLARPADGRSLLVSPSMAETVRLAGCVAATLTIACGVIALVVYLWFAVAARRWLAFPFAGIPARPSTAAIILSRNLRALAAVFGLLLIAQSAYWNAAGAEPGPAHRTLRRLGEALLGAAVGANLVVIGASFGAYGTRMVRAALPHGPVELAAYSLGLSLYLQGRRRPLPARSVVAVLALSVFALALAAFLETYVNV
jgi:hypothetical protein